MPQGVPRVLAKRQKLYFVRGPAQLIVGLNEHKQLLIFACTQWLRDQSYFAVVDTVQQAWQVVSDYECHRAHAA